MGIMGWDEASDADTRPGSVLERKVHAYPPQVGKRLVPPREFRRFGDGGELRGGEAIDKEGADAVDALEGTQVPGEGEQVAPPAFLGQEIGEAVDVVSRHAVSEGREPPSRDLRNVGSRGLRSGDAELVERG